MFFPPEETARSKALRPGLEKQYEGRRIWGVRSHLWSHHEGHAGIYKISGFYSETGNPWELSGCGLTQPGFHNWSVNFSCPFPSNPDLCNCSSHAFSWLRFLPALCLSQPGWGLFTFCQVQAGRVPCRDWLGRESNTGVVGWRPCPLLMVGKPLVLAQLQCTHIHTCTHVQGTQ